ncbi:concanavalin A-like lectin/glucanase domain-containing protein [Kockovaella imperatae]|uniref:Concanavalin A-like lectin/glucanase domain-containing protein n=1 Tax=Kockovaella imperatae TaxID=4999 RepID=A0A1Y1UCY0_9TREE|nr:concanavalin A-like lectin/glucanase domain-containing protein [Kockovaella imperatae]ORX35900.1 concanavalin A-like lectin/glucanase domain-containing protein [Kockovaella imperatae]
MALKTSLLLSTLPLVLGTTYPLIESWSGSGFMDGFRYPASFYDNTTNGDVFWATAANTSLIYTSSSGTTILKVDNTSYVPYNEKRYAPKILSKTEYQPGTVWVFDAVHMPYGCSVWPAVWTQGPDWPEHGEIDIMEGINQQTTNQVALHTAGSGCLASSSSSLSGGTLTYDNCSIGAHYDSGCTTNMTNADTYGSGFAAAGGGVYVAEFATDGIRIWFFTRSSVPSSFGVSSKSIDTSSLGTPAAEYLSSSCNITEYFSSQIFTIDITLCGDWAGIAANLEETCPQLQGDNTCYTTYVINNASTTYANAYFEINYLNVYSTSTSGSSSSGSSASGASSTITAGVSPTSGSSSKTSGAASPVAIPSLSHGKISLAGVVVAGLLAGFSLL